MPSLSSGRILLLLIFSSQILQVFSSSSCSAYLVRSIPTTFACGTPHRFDSSDFTVPTPFQQQLALSFTIQPQSLCVSGSNPVLVTVSIIPLGTSSRRNVLMISYSQTNQAFYFHTEDSNGARIFYTKTGESSFLNEPMSFFVGIDMASPFIKSGMIIGSKNTFPALQTSLSFGSDWVFDSSTVISVCSDYSGNNGMNCIIQNLKVAYKMPSQIITMLISNTPTIIGDYKLEEGSGSLLEDSLETLGTSSLSSSPSPIWTSVFFPIIKSSFISLGVNGAIANQYVKIPGFIPSGHDLSIVVSVGFAFYIKIDQAPTTDTTIFSYYCDSISSQIFSLELLPSTKLKLNVYDASVQTTSTFTLGTWVTLYVVYTLSHGGYGGAKVYIDGVDPGGLASKSNTAGPPPTFSTSDVLKIGSFEGHLRRFQVFSPAACPFITSTGMTCNPTTCSVETAPSDPPTCLEAICTTGYYSSIGTCETCYTGCGACIGPGSENCQSCSTGFYPSGTDCPACPMHCSSCTDSNTCQACKTGYGLYNNLCMLCPAGTYLSNQVCKQFSPAIQETLKNSQLLNSAATQAANVMSKGKAISLSAMVAGKIFAQIKYLNISYSGELQVALKTWLPGFISLGLTPNMPNPVQQKFPERYVPYVFEKYEVSSSFLINFWENLGIVFFVSILWLFFKGFESKLSPQQNPGIASFMKKARILIQNISIIVLYSVYGDLILFAIIEYRSLVIGWNLSLLSVVISVILIAAMFISFFFQIQILLNYRKIKKQTSSNGTSKSVELEKFIKDNEGSQVFFKEFKDYSLAPQLFIFFLTGKDLIFSLILATMFEYPLAQALLITILNSLMIVYLFIQKPFQETFDFVQQLFFEFTGLAVNVAVVINAILDAGKYETVQARNNIGKLIIVINMIFNFVTATFMIISVAVALRKFYRAHKEKQAQKLEKMKFQTRIQRRLTDYNPIHKSQDNENISSDQSLIQENTVNLDLLPQQIPPSYQRNRPRRNPKNLSRGPQNPSQEPPHFHASNLIRYNKNRRMMTSNLNNSVHQSHK